MSDMQFRNILQRVFGFAFVWIVSCAFGLDLAPPQILNISATNSQKRLLWTPYPAAEQYKIFSTLNLTVPFLEDLSGSFSGNAWFTSANDPARFFQLQVTPMSSNAVLTANLLNRIAYGPTPDELERLMAIGPDAYLQEQLNFGSLPEPVDQYISEATNSVPPEAAIKTNWVNIRIAGRVTSQTLYMYLTAPGEVFVDDVALYAGTGTNINTAINYVQNGDFESPLSGPWTVSPNLSGSALTTDVKASGSASLRMVASSAGSTQSSSIWQSLLPGLTNN